MKTVPAPIQDPRVLPHVPADVGEVRAVARDFYGEVEALVVDRSDNGVDHPPRHVAQDDRNFGIATDVHVLLLSYRAWRCSTMRTASSTSASNIALPLACEARVGSPKTPLSLRLPSCSAP